MTEGPDLLTHFMQLSECEDLYEIEITKVTKLKRDWQLFTQTCIISYIVLRVDLDTISCSAQYFFCLIHVFFLQIRSCRC